MKKLYIRRASELVTCRGSAPKKGAELADIGLIKNGGVLSWISWQALKRAPVRLTHVRKLPLAIRSWMPPERPFFLASWIPTPTLSSAATGPRSFPGA